LVSFFLIPFWREEGFWERKGGITLLNRGIRKFGGLIQGKGLANIWTFQVSIDLGQDRLDNFPGIWFFPIKVGTGVKKKPQVAGFSRTTEFFRLKPTLWQRGLYPSFHEHLLWEIVSGHLIFPELFSTRKKLSSLPHKPG